MIGKTMYGSVGETIQWDTYRGVLSGKIVFVHTDMPSADNTSTVDYYSIATGPDPMDRHFLDSDTLNTMNVVNLSA